MKKILCVLAAALMLSAGAGAAFERVNTYNNNFSDVADTNWFGENVKTAYELGFMNGKSEGKFDPNGNVTIVEGITMASRLHALYNNTEVKPSEKVTEEFVIGFNDANNIVDLTQRNSRNDTGISFNRCTGEVVDGCLVAQPDAPNNNNVYDPQITINGLELASSDYNRLKFRMKVEKLPNAKDPEKRSNVTQLYFKTSASPSITADKCIYVKMSDFTDNIEDWFEVELDVGSHEKWTDNITGIRFDPSDDNGVYYIDYISFSKSETLSTEKWYDMYIDYAVENGIIAKNRYLSSDYNKNITRAEICDLFVSAIPEEHFPSINDIKGIPDVLRDAKNADVYLMLYKAGVLLGDSAGNFNPKADIKRSEIAAIINRVALPEARVKGTVEADWSKQGNEYDIEFNDASSFEQVNPIDIDSAEIVNGAVVIVPKDRGESQNGRLRFDPKISVKNISVDAEKFAKLKVRMKVEFADENPDPKLTKFDFYFMTEGDTGLSEAKSMHQAFTEYSYLDPAGWYVMEVDFRLHNEWNGTITEFRFDPANTNGVYTIDYIRLAPADPLFNASHETLLAEGYTATRLMQDEHFERGFGVAQTEQKEGYTHGTWQDFCETDEKPLWGVGPWWIGTGEGFTTVDLWDNRDTSADKYTLTDTYGINTIRYNPEEKSVIMRQNAANIYKGQPHNKDTYKWWPHLLLEQSTSLTGAVDKVRNSAASDRTFFEIDIKMNDYKPTTNEDGTNVSSFLIYYYLVTDKAPGQRIWFGLKMFTGDSGSEAVTATWAPDSAAHQYMYGIPPAVIYDGIENSFNPEKGVVKADGEWKHIRLDVTPHIERAVEWANRDNIFGTEVTVEDMYWNGVNIGFETHGNFDYEFEFKNFNMISYDK